MEVSLNTQPPCPITIDVSRDLSSRGSSRILTDWVVYHLYTFIKCIFLRKLCLCFQGLLFCEHSLTGYFFIDSERDFRIQFFDDIDITVDARHQGIIERASRYIENTQYFINSPRTVKSCRINIRHIPYYRNTWILERRHCIDCDRREAFSEENPRLISTMDLLVDSRRDKRHDRFTGKIKIWWSDVRIRVFEHVIETAHLCTIFTQMRIDDFREKGLEQIEVTAC